MNAKQLTKVFAANIKQLPIAPIAISGPKGAQEVDGLLLGDWALNENSAGWTVTHRRTGYAGKSFPTPIEALVSLGVYLGSGLKIPDDVKALADVPDIGAIRGRIHIALALVDSWVYSDEDDSPKD